MFRIPQPRNRSRNLALASSFVLHCLVIYILAHRAPIFVKPSSVAWGMHGKSEAIVYFAQNTTPESDSQKLVLPQKPKHKAPKETPQKPDALRAGSERGSLDHGPAIGIEAMPALPLIFPDPAIFPWQLGKLRGDVVVEVTIDTQGNVTNTRVLQSLQQGIDEKIVETLKGWRFKPASVDGVAISSRQDVHFHFPS
jgi:TonB family protein